MYALRIQRTFSAAHAITIDGQPETLHGHDWRVRVIVEGPDLDRDGLLCDFHDLERWLDAVISPWRDQTLNDTPPFDEINPTAEQIAASIAASLEPHLPHSVKKLTVAITESPGCEASMSKELKR